MMRRALAKGLRVCCVMALLVLSCLVFGHPGHLTAARAKVALDGSFELKVRFDVLSYCLDIPAHENAEGPINALLDGPVESLERALTEAKERFVPRVVGGRMSLKSFPTASEIKKMIEGRTGNRLPIMAVAVLEGQVSKSSSFSFPEMLGVVILTTEFPYQEPISEPVDPGATSLVLTLPTVKAVESVKKEVTRHQAGGKPSPAKEQPKAAEVNPFAKARASAAILTRVESATSQEQEQEQEPETAPSPRAEAPAGPVVVAAVERPAWYTLFPGYVKLGFVHILPYGLDHILFVIGLFLLSTRAKDLLKQVTAFTIAHSLTLALSLYGLIRLPAAVVEPLIALSIVFVAVENLFSSKLNKWRPWVVFLFGLMHGLGFAGILQDAGLAQGNFLAALLGFNIGVELGQLAVIAAAFLAVGWFRNHQRYRSLVAMPASLIIAVVASVWTVQRLWG